MLAVLYVFRRPLVEPLIPAFRTGIELLTVEFRIESADVVPTSGGDVLRFRANLASPLRIGNRIVEPFGWNRMPQGGFQVDLGLAGLLQYSAMMLIVVLAWPARGMRDVVTRLVLCVPVGAALMLIEAPSTVVAELWHGLRTGAGVAELSAWMVWSRFLMGGGGLVIAGLAGAGIIAVTRWFAQGPRPRPEPGHARLVLSARHRAASRDG